MHLRRSRTPLIALIPSLLLLVLCACSLAESSPPAGAGASAGPRTLSRSPTGEVALDEAFFAPFFAQKEAPERLRKAWDALVRGEDKKARLQLEEFLSKQGKHPEAPRAAFLLAWMERQAGQHGDAARRFEEVAGQYPLLADHARYWGALSAFDSRDYERSVKLCLAISMASGFGPRSQYLRGRALLRLNQDKKSIEVLEDFLERFPSASYAGDVRLTLAVAYEEDKRWADAARAYHRLRTRYPGRSLEREAEAGVKRVSKQLSKADRDRLLGWSHKDRLRRAQALYDVHRSQRAIEEMDDLLKEKDVQIGEALWCEATFLQGQAWRKERDHKAAASAYGRFLEHCPEGPDTIKALYSGARSLWTVDQDKRALAWFERVWRDFANHSYADDSMLYAARIHASRGELDKEAQMLDLQVRTFPRGDMIADAHWRRFLLHYQAGRYKEAVAYADEHAHNCGESTLYNRGRLLYFRARALEAQGQERQAVLGYTDVLSRAPMSYYALLALNRVKALDQGEFERLVNDIVQRESGGGQWSIEPPQLAEDSRFRRGVELLRLGLFEAAQDEFDDLKRGYPRQDKVLWTLALLFDRAGAHHLSHNIPRRQIGSFGTTWPVGEERALYELAFPRPYHDQVAAWASKRQIPEALIYAIMREESGFNPRIESWAHAFGLMQLILPTAQQMARADGMKKPDKLDGADLFQPDTNIRLGSLFLSKLSQGYQNHPAVTISGYNGGFGNVDRWLRERGGEALDLWVENMPFGQTRHYTKRVLMSLWIYQWLYGPSQKDTSAMSRMITVPLEVPPPSQ